ncbi:MAG: adenylyl-sulfate kinase [Bacteroidetes bacterium]|nr:adenylyl-sulfate kinase [Bacteroidota bacterium]
MTKPSSNIFKAETFVSQANKESLLKQKAVVVWLFGLSGAGKSTIAVELENKLYKEGFLTKLLDGDNLRLGLNKGLGFTDDDRAENLRRSAEVAKLFYECGIVTICSFITPLASHREIVKNIVGDGLSFVYINCEKEICEKRDVKGLYAKARNAEIVGFTGVGSSFEVPSASDLVIDTSNKSIAQSVEELYQYIVAKIKI